MRRQRRLRRKRKKIMRTEQRAGRGGEEKIRDAEVEEAEKKAQEDYEDKAKNRPWRRREEQRLPEGEVTIEEAEEEQGPKASGAKKRGPKTKKKPGPKELKDNSIFHEFPGNKVRVILIHNNAFLLISIPV